MSVPLARSAATVAAVSPSARPRLLFVDFVRLFASFQMLHGHTIDALLHQDLRSGPVFAVWSWQRGLVSVSFLFVAGVAFSLSTLVRPRQWMRDRKRVARRWRRIGWLVVLGYSMHFPVEAFSRDPDRARASLHAFFIADVLQCIGVSIALLQLLLMVLRDRRRMTFATALLALCFISLAPLADRIEPGGAWRPCANYLSHRGGSLFPLFPWAGYVFAGVAAASWLAPDGAVTAAREAARRALIATSALFGLWALVRWLPFELATRETTHHAVPAFALLKLAVVTLIVFVLALVAVRVRRLPRLLQVLAGESLMLYWFHLMVLYGAGVGLRARIGPTLPLEETLGVASGVVVVSASVGLLWHRLKGWHRSRGEATGIGSWTRT